MKNILVLGAGMSATCLIEYLLKESEKTGWKVRVGDISVELAQSKTGNHPNSEVIKFDIHDEEQRRAEISKSDLVVSLLPARFHPIVAKTCLQYGKNMVTASYVSDEMKSLEEEVKKAGLVFINEVGVDPGIDHMSAMQIINKIKSSGGDIHTFKSYTGGLVAPKYDNNPWNYKFTWNPRNVVLAGQGTAKFIRNGKYKYIPYHKLFTRTERIFVERYGEFEGYANRDSLKYRSIYGLDDIKTMLRGTLRRPGFSKAWNVFVQLGMTDDSYVLDDSENMTYREFTNTYLKYSTEKSVEEKISEYLGISEDSHVMYQLRWLGIFDNKKIGLKNATPAQILQKLLMEKWKLEEDDKDMIVMQHQFDYEINNRKRRIISSMVIEGKDKVHTAMAITVGTPAAIAAKMVLTGKINKPGVHIPVFPDIYEPILEELKEYGIKFDEQEFDL